MTITLPKQVCNCGNPPQTTDGSWYCPVHGQQTVILRSGSSTGILEGK